MYIAAARSGGRATFTVTVAVTWPWPAVRPEKSHDWSRVHKTSIPLEVFWNFMNVQMLLRAACGPIKTRLKLNENSTCNIPPPPFLSMIPLRFLMSDVGHRTSPRRLALLCNESDCVPTNKSAVSRLTSEPCTETHIRAVQTHIRASDVRRTLSVLYIESSRGIR